MRQIKEIIQKNLIYLRKQHNMTQVEVATQINYSDKAVSRWENGDALPDYDTLAILANLYDVPVAYLFEEHDDLALNQEIIKRKESRIALTILLIITVWTIATTFFSNVLLTFEKAYWQAFIWAIPASALVLAIGNKIRFHSKFLFLFSTSFVLWGTLLGLFCQMIHHHYAWLVFIIGVPLQGALIVLSYIFYRK